MKKRNFFNFLFVMILLLNCMVSKTANADSLYKKNMQNLVLEIRGRAGSDKIIIGNGGVGLFYTMDEIDTRVFDALDGSLVESLMYGGGGYNKKTSDYQRNDFLKLLRPLSREGKKIFTIDYTDNETSIKEVQEFNKQNNFIGATPRAISLNSIYSLDTGANSKEIMSIGDVENFLIILNYEKYKTADMLLSSLKNTDFDLLILDMYFHDRFLTMEEVESLKVKANGQKRKVICYLSVGEAETYRSYWQESWNKRNPSWIVEKNQNWANNYKIKYWDPVWKGILENQQKKADSLGFDGYFLDTIDSFYWFESR